MLRRLPPSVGENILVGLEQRDDAAVVRISDSIALVQTIDFLTPIVDDPYSYGAIAAANSLSDIYAMGGKPLTALNVACFNPDAAPAEVWAAIFQGIADKCAEAGASLVGGHTVDDSEPKFGLSVLGIVEAERMFLNTMARPGDEIALTKALGVGIVATAAKNDLAHEAEVSAAIASMEQLNDRACALGLELGARCATDITGFGLAGHLFNVARASDVSIEIESSALPVLAGVQRLAGKAPLCGGAARNRAFLGDSLEVSPGVPPWLLELALDPQTSGGLALFLRGRQSEAPVVGRVIEGPPKVLLR